MVQNRHFDDSVPVHFDKGRKKPVHSIKYGDILDALPFEDPQGAGAVVYLFSA